MHDDDYPDFDEIAQPEPKDPTLPPAKLKGEIEIPIRTDQIVEKVAARLVDQIMRKGEKELLATFASALSARVIAEADAIVSRVLAEPLPQTNRYGEQTKEPKPLREWLNEQVMGWLDGKVKADGRPADGYDTKNDVPRRVMLVNAHLVKPLRDEMEASLKKSAADARATAIAMLSTMLAEKMQASAPAPTLLGR